jgi:diguanylate cyclase (GGDEF)-like protein
MKTEFRDDHVMTKSGLFRSLTSRIAIALLLASLCSVVLVALALWQAQPMQETIKSNTAALKAALDLKSERLAAGLVGISDNQVILNQTKATLEATDPAVRANLAKRILQIVSLEGAENAWILDASNGSQILSTTTGSKPSALSFSKAIEPGNLAKSGVSKAIGYLFVNGQIQLAAVRVIPTTEANEKFILLASTRLEKALSDDGEIRGLPAYVLIQKRDIEAPKVLGHSPVIKKERSASALQADSTQWQRQTLIAEPGLALEVATPLERPLRQLFSTAAVEIGIAAFSVIAMCIGVAFWWGKRITTPINNIQFGIKRIAEGDYKPLSNVSSSKEISLLAESFNLMAEGMRQREKGIMNVAYRDPLTNLPNRALFSSRLQEAIVKYRQGSKGISTLLIDIDNFTMINDSFGQVAGDEVLKETASRFRQVLRNADSLLRVEAVNTKDGNLTIARMGSSDFCILLQNCDAEQARKVALRLRDALEQPFNFRGQVVEAASRIGIASFPEHAADAVGLMSCADAALAKSKTFTGAISVFDPEVEKHRELQLSLLIDLKRSLERDELALVFQPRVSLAEKAPLMVEALLRWEHPERGLINPNDFVPFAEKTGFITLMTRWVIDQSLKQVNLWQKEAISVEVSVNVSLRDLSDKDFPTYVVSRLRAHKIAPQRLTLEVPDKVLALGYERILPQLTILAGVGVKIALDDFGGGFTSLQYLREMKATSTKIDRAFISELKKDKSRAILVSSAIALSHSMKMTVVAQGVEDKETLALLRRLKCDFAQGYYFGKPLKAAEYKRWVQHQAEKYQTGEIATVSEV